VKGFLLSIARQLDQGAQTQALHTAAVLSGGM